MKPKNKPLKVTVSNGVLRIEIGVDTLAHAYLRSDHAWEMINYRMYSNLKPDDVFTIKSTGFARDVARELLDEAEDGSSLLTRALDEACAEAVEQGSEYLITDED